MLPPSGSMRSQAWKTARSSISSSRSIASPVAAIASTMMLRRCCQQSPRYVMYFSLRSSSLMASHASRPTCTLIAAMTASVSIRRVQRAQLHVSVQRTVSSARRCSPMFSGDGPPAACQLPSPFAFSNSSLNSERRRRECARMWVSMCASTAFDVPPSGRMERPRRQMSSIEPSAYCTCALQLKTPSPNFVLSSQPKERIRTAMANLYAAIAWLQTVTSVRSSLACEGDTPGTSMPGTTASSTSLIFIEVVEGATPRAS
mmetsp:Transcript_12189/g.27840  ORF Transcript_12189/g.27840 Transcript_12189/m.27840 type:complete len:259 (+) Transcript_12189:2171-2947(+)